MNAEAEKIIALLGLAPLPHEGGFFRRTWTSPTTLPDGRAAGSAIYFLLTPGDFSALHRLQTDEAWFFHAGDPVEHVQLIPDGRTTRVALLGSDPLAGFVPQLIVPAGVWQGARLAPPNGAQPMHDWALVSSTMAPAWDEREFELGGRAELLCEFPEAADLIRALTR